MVLKLYSGLESLKPDRFTHKKTYLQKIFYPKAENLINYSKGRIFIGWDSPHKDEQIYLDVSQSEIILVVGMRGAGKTRLLRMFAEELHLSNNKVTFHSDIKNENSSSINEMPINNENDLKYYRKGEIQQGMPMKIYQPMFLIEKGKDVDENCEPFQIGFKDLTLDDWLTIFGVVEEKDIAKAEIIKTIFKHIEDGNITDIESLKIFIEETDLIHKASKKVYLMTIDNLINYDVIGEEYPIDVIDDVIKKNIIVLNLKGYKKFAKSRFHHLYIAYINRVLTAAAMENKFGTKIFYFIDEASKICPKSGNNTAIPSILYSIDESRSWGISLILASQELNDLPEKIFRQTRYVFIPHSMLFEDFSKILKRIGMGGWHPSMMEKWRKMLNSCKVFKDGQRDWILVDKKTSKILKFVPKAPVSEHMEQID